MPEIPAGNALPDLGLLPMPPPDPARTTESPTSLQLGLELDDAKSEGSFQSLGTTPGRFDDEVAESLLENESDEVKSETSLLHLRSGRKRSDEEEEDEEEESEEEEGEEDDEDDEMAEPLPKNKAGTKTLKRPSQDPIDLTSESPAKKPC